MIRTRIVIAQLHACLLILTPLTGMSQDEAPVEGPGGVANQVVQQPTPPDSQNEIRPRSAEQILGQSISFEAKELPLRTVLSQIAELAHVELNLDTEALLKAGFDLDRSQNISVTDVGVFEVLNTLLNTQRPFTWAEIRVRNSILTISSAAAKLVVNP